MDDEAKIVCQQSWDHWVKNSVPLLKLSSLIMCYHRDKKVMTHASLCHSALNFKGCFKLVIIFFLG